MTDRLYVNLETLAVQESFCSTWADLEIYLVWIRANLPIIASLRATFAASTRSLVY